MTEPRAILAAICFAYLAWRAFGKEKADALDLLMAINVIMAGQNHD